MGSFSVWHWVIALVMVLPLLALALVPAWRILHRAGFSGAWSLLLLVPGLNFLVPWVLAFVEWPNDSGRRTRTSVGGIVLGVLLVPLAIGAIALFGKAGAGPAGLGASTPRPAASQAQPSRNGQIDWEKGAMTAPAPQPEEQGPWTQYRK